MGTYICAPDGCDLKEFYWTVEDLYVKHFTVVSIRFLQILSTLRINWKD